MFNLRVLNFKTSQTRVSNFQNVAITGTPLGFAIKSYQNFQNTPHISLGKQKKKKKKKIDKI
jgi:hypothetical protein